MTSQDYYFHPPGQIARWGVLDVGLKCPHSCVHCYYAFLPDGSDNPKKFAGMRRADWKATDKLIAQIDAMADNGFLGFDLTGGEPTLHPDIVGIIRHATERGLSTRMITLGQFLTAKGLLGRLLDAGLTDILFSYHSCDEKLFAKMTGGKLSKMQDAMDILDQRGFAYSTNAICIGENYQSLPELARTITERNVYVANFILMNAYYQWADGKAATVRARYVDVATYLREAVEILEEHGIAVNIRYAPLCTVAGMEKNYVGVVGVRYDPHEWVNTVQHIGEGLGAGEGHFLPMRQGDPSPGTALVGNAETGKPVGRGTANGLMKVFAPQCANCSAQKVCDGIDFSYLQQVGADEFVPYVGEDRGQVLDKDRLAYYAGHIIKRRQMAPVKDATARLLGKRPLGAKPLVTAVVANYNYADYVGKCLDSLLGQTWPQMEVIVVDDCSTDNSREVLKTYEDRCTVIYRPTNSGNPCHPHNEAIARGKGELVMYLDSDDWVAPTYVEECVKLLQRNPAASIAYPGTVTHGMAEEIRPAHPYDPHRLLTANFIPCCSVYRREMWDEVGGYKDNVKGADDWNMWVAGASRGFLGVHLSRQMFHYLWKADGLYETESRPYHEARFRQVIENNSDIYPPELVRWAKTPLQPAAPVQAAAAAVPEEAVDRALAIDLPDTYEGVRTLLEHTGSLNVVQLIYLIYRLLLARRFCSAYVVSKGAERQGVAHPVVPMARALGGLLYPSVSDETTAVSDLHGLLRSLSGDQQTVFVESVVVPLFRQLLPLLVPRLDDGSLQFLLAIFEAGYPPLDGAPSLRLWLSDRAGLQRRLNTVLGH
ncbi:MAG TPA: glycosyltransferase [Candidatus Sulfotelmatobacter sp.]|jgi:pyrroloquinoline quinone biosynthesis protein E|nr:glycosyltransferase [Candidatus Sulfotelmatobacter sp.]